ncbi:MFS transporter, partial [Agrococcus casei]|uniref:MFS transporter n=1 Tax=Agrococcus casei TaxID=343512 RepID=UPI003F934C97
MSNAPAARQTRAVAKARFGASVAFAIVGFLLAVWLVHIPAVQQATGISKAELGTTLLALGLGSLISMQAGGLLISRFGARMPLLAGHLLLAVTLLAPAFATDAVTLGIALFLFGLGNGLADVSMNAEAVEVERDRGKAIMSSMHAFFSIGTALGAAYGWLVQTVQLAVLPSFVIAAALAVGFAFVAMALLPKRGAEPDVTTSELLAVSRASGDSRPGKSTRTVPISQIVLLALLAFVLMLAEGVASDWSALHAVDVLGESE